jgi:nucleoside-triphosphatase
MGRLLLFTGTPRIGKSTAVQKVVDAVGKERCAGFFTAEERHEGHRTGFSVCMIDGPKGSLASINSTSTVRLQSFSQGREISYGVDLGFLEEVAVPILRESLKDDRRQFLVIDEIGPMQLYSQVFKDLILSLADADDILLFGSIVERQFPWTDELKALPNVETFLLTTQNRATLAQMMADYLVCRVTPGLGTADQG